jgi:FtsP/CotA-like multicopper oxidase with cupredoxin domain
VGSDGGLFERPVEVDELLIANAERVEVLVRGTGAPGSTAVLETLPYDRYMPQTRPADWDQSRELLTLQYTDAPPVTPDPGARDPASRSPASILPRRARPARS